MRQPFIINPKADKNELGTGLGELITQSHALIDRICEREGEDNLQLLWTLNTMIDQADEISETLGL